MLPGRSRGRAKTTPTNEPQPPTPATSTARLPPQGANARIPSPQRVQPETGRGRGITPSEVQSQISANVGASSTTTSTTTPTGGAGVTASGDISPNGGNGSGSSESPPEQHSPPHQPAAGRAAVRGGPHASGPGMRSDILGPMERLQLQQTGDVQPEAPRRERTRIESVPVTKPAHITEKTGSAGEKIKLFCNYFEILQHPNWILYQYHVDYSPVIESKKMRIALLRPHEHLFANNKAFDGFTLFTLTRLPDNQDTLELTSIRETDNAPIKLTIKKVAEVVPTSPNFIHLFNVIFRKCLRLYGMKEIDRGYYDTQNRIQIREYNLELINGLATSIGCYDDEKLLLCTELTHKILHNGNVYEFMRALFQKANNEALFKDNCSVELVGKIVMTKYSEKTYKIDDIDWESNPTSTFEYRGEMISFVEYYKKHYAVEIQDVQQPLLVILPNAREKRQGMTKPKLLIPELCTLTGVSERMRTDFNFKKTLEQFSKVDPNSRCQKMNDFIQRFQNKAEVKGELDGWQMKFSNMPLEIEARCLPPETLAFGRGKLKKLDERADWGNDIKGLEVYSSVPLNKWCLLYPARGRQAANNFLNIFGRIVNGLGIKAIPPVEIQLPNDNADTFINALKQNIKDGVQMMVTLVTNKRKDRYDAIKRVCCLEIPVPSQVCTTAILENDKKATSVVTKIILQMNCKLGGELWITNIPMKNVMICGIDTYHDSATKRSSVCAFIATTNQTKSKFFSRATIQETHQELSDNLTLTVKSACDYYRKVNGAFPEKVVIFRDGVSDGQLSSVINYEIPQIQKAFQLADPEYKPGLAFLVVKKRGNSRFFAKSGNGCRNAPCGTVIDKGVTRPEWCDFYLIPQNTTQGTANPTHINIIYDTVRYKVDHYQLLSFKLCHMYYNWPGTIRVPALCQYAHKLAFLVGQSLHKEHHTSLCDKLFYL